MATIVPAILEDNIDLFLDKQSEIFKIAGLQRVQIDISDGKYTPRKTLALSDLDVLNPAYEWEAHLMVENPQSYFFDAKLLGFNTVIFHFEAIKDKSKIPELAEELRGYKIKPGLAINPETPVEEILPYVDFFELIQILAVQPGYQGEEQAPNIVEKVQKLKKHLKNAIIEVDGSVNSGNIVLLLEAGADLLVVGSALYSEGLSPAQNFEKLEQVLPKT